MRQTRISKPSAGERIVKDIKRQTHNNGNDRATGPRVSRLSRLNSKQMAQSWLRPDFY